VKPIWNGSVGTSSGKPKMSGGGGTNDRKMTDASVKASREQLEEIIVRWVNAVSVEQFFRGVDQRAAELPEEERSLMLTRLALARDHLASLDPLQFFLDWRTPLERYRPRYEDNEVPRTDDSDE